MNLGQSSKKLTTFLEDFERTEQVICKICNKEFKNDRALSSHVKVKHNMNYVQYNVDFLNFKIPKCPYCNENRMKRTNLEFNQTCGNKTCVSKHRSKRTRELLDNGMREKISISMKKAHNEGRAWNIGMSRWNNEPSYPEQFFMNAIDNEFDDKNYIREYNVGIYSIDFAWIYKKIAIEIDGDQHYRFTEYKERDIRKDRYLHDNGWKVLRIKWKDFYNNPKHYIRYCNNFINNENFTIDEHNITIDYEALKRTLNNETISKQNYNKHVNINLKIDQIRNSNINFNKHGWVSEVSKILDITPQKVTQWMRKNMYEFWNENCFKRKGTKMNN